MTIRIKLFGRLKPISSYKKSLKSYRRWALVFSGLLLMNFVIDAFLVDEESQLLPYITFSIHGEQIKEINDSTANLYINYGLDIFHTERINLVEKDELRKDIFYATEPPPDLELIYGKYFESFEDDKRTEENGNPLKHFFHLIKTPTSFCRKLYRAGGELGCRLHEQMIPKMDGHKLICVDEVLQVVGSPDTKDCLTLSFGVNYDISFDINIRNANCEVMMFDSEEYEHPVIEGDEYVTFFQMGLATERIDHYIADQKKTIEFDTFNNLAFEHDFVNRLINIIKIDIEGDEWDVLKDMANRPYLDTIGQIAVEVHGLKLKSLNSSQQQEWVTSVKDTFLVLQERGFRRVSYFDNVMSEFISTDDVTVTYYAAGELLMVNSNWYNKYFREEARQNGLKFLPL